MEEAVIREDVVAEVMVVTKTAAVTGKLENDAQVIGGVCAG